MHLLAKEVLPYYTYRHGVKRKNPLKFFDLSDFEDGAEEDLVKRITKETMKESLKYVMEYIMDPDKIKKDMKTTSEYQLPGHKKPHKYYKKLTFKKAEEQIAGNQRITFRMKEEQVASNDPKLIKSLKSLE